MPTEAPFLPLDLALRVLAGALVHVLLRLGLHAGIGPRLAVRAADLRNAFTCGILLVAALALVAPRLDFPLASRAAFLGALLFVVGFALNVVEFFFFSTTRPRTQIVPALGALLLHGATAVVAALLFPPGSTGDSLGSRLAEAFGGRHVLDWAWRFACADLAYAAIYILVGSLVWPLVKPSYVNPPQGLELRVPRGSVIFPLQLARGLVYTTVVAVLIAATGLRGGNAVAGVVVFLSVVGGIVPLVSVSTWPLFLRIVHGVEVATQLALFGAAATFFVGGA